MSDGTGQPFTALDIAAAFLDRYYEVLNGSPEDLFRFYSEDAVLSHGSEGDAIDVVSGIAAVKDKLDSLRYKGCGAQLAMIDANFSFNNAVVIVTTGNFSEADGTNTRKFMQTFLLNQAPNEERLFIRNHSVIFLDTTAPLTPVPAAPAAVETSVVAPADVATPEPAVAAQSAVEQAPRAAAAEAAEVPAATPPAASHTQPQEQRASQGKTWADLFAGGPAQGQQRKAFAEQAPAKAPPASAPAAAPADGGPRGTDRRAKGGRAGQNAPEGTALFINNLPAACTTKQLTDVLARVGPVVSCDINVKGFAFVEMRSADIAAAAVARGAEGSLRIGNNTLGVQLKRRQNKRRGGRS